MYAAALNTTAPLDGDHCTASQSGYTLTQTPILKVKAMHRMELLCRRVTEVACLRQCKTFIQASKQAAVTNKPFNDGRGNAHVVG